MKKTLQRITPLSPFEKRVYQHIDYVKEQLKQTQQEYEKAKKHWTTIKYFEKKDWLLKYLVDLEIFNISKLYRHIIDMKNDYGDKHERMIAKTTLALFLERLHDELDQNGETLLGHKKLPTNRLHFQYIYWIPDIDSQKRDRKVKEYLEGYKEPKPHKKDKRKQQLDNTVQSRLTNYDANIIADDLIAEKEKQRLEEKKLERQKQQELERQQKEIENKEKNERKKAALIESVDKETVKKSKKTKDGTKTISPVESKKKVEQLNEERQLKQEEQEYLVVKAKLTREKTVSGGSE